MSDLRFVIRYERVAENADGSFVGKPVRILQQRVDGEWVDVPLVSEEQEDE
jgi:hypothetical protein